MELCTILLKQSSDLERFSLLIESMLEFLSSHIEMLSEIEILNILQLITTNNKYLQNNFGITSFLNATKKVAAFEKESNEISRYILGIKGNRNKTLNLVLYTNQEQDEKILETDWNFLRQTSGMYSRSHNCSEVQNSAKRLKLQNDTNFFDIKRTLIEMLENSKQITKYGSEMDEESAVLITEIVDNLNSASGVKKSFLS